jgi:hypothetical protein
MHISLDVMVAEWTVKNANFSTLRGTRIFPMAVGYMKLNPRQLQMSKF